MLELRLEKMIHGGRVLARLADGRVALVRGGLPGERVAAELSERKGVLQGWVTEVLEASADRIAPPEHPGLDYGFVAYPRQLELKREVVKDALARAVKRDVAVPEVRPAPQLWHYRSAVQPVAVRTGLGYRLPESHEVVVLDTDPVANPAVDKVWQAWSTLDAPKGVREVVLRGNDFGEVLASLVATTSAKNLLPFAHDLLGAGVVGVSYAPFDVRGRFRQGSEKLAGEKTILQPYGSFTVSVSATNFAQPNPAAASQLYKALVDLAPSGKLALDLYAGSGVIGMHLLSRYERVIALEIDRGSVVRGKRDAERLGLTGLEFLKADAKQVEVPPDTDLVTVDPPRSGLNKDLRETLTQSGVSQLIYVSCDVATWARDVADLEVKGWRLESFEPFDFYPHTHHIELLSKLVR